jgi:methionyl-tRNA formyltransferase
MDKLPYILFESPPIGPIALEALIAGGYPPAKVIDDPKMPLEEQLAIVGEVNPTFFLVVGYGAILKRDLLDTVAGQVLNVHPSLLPLYRGPAPVVGALLDGVTETGVTLIEIDTKMDHGPILAQESIPLRGSEKPRELYEILTRKGIHLFLETIDAYLTEEADLLPQEHGEATFTHFVKKEDGRLDFGKPVTQLEHEIRAYSGWPRSFADFRGKRLIIESAHLTDDQLVIDQVQPEGGKIMPLAEFLRGQRLSAKDFYREFSS